MHLTRVIDSIRKGSIEIPEYIKASKGYNRKHVSLEDITAAIKSLHIPKEIVTINPRVYDGMKHPPIGSVQLPLYTWDIRNFEGFLYDLNDDLGAEQLTIMSIDGRTIKQNNLIYTTRGQGKTLNAVKYAFHNDYTAAASAGLEKFSAGCMSANAGQYTVVGWQAEKYVGIKNKPYKLAKIIIEQGNALYEKKTLVVGETWDVGGGWKLAALAIDAKTIPKQVWLALIKDGIRVDDKVVAQGMIYTYVEKIVGGEVDVPVFVTYIDSIFAGATSDMVQLRYTWAIDTSITEIKRGDKFGVFTVQSTTPNIVLQNIENTVILSKGSIVDLLGNLKFKVADTDTLRFYPQFLRA